MTTNGSGEEIRVFDESGVWIGTTYPKRAKGLVKKGRARWYAGTPNTSEPVNEPDSIILYRNLSGAEAESANIAPQKSDYSEDIMSEFNTSRNNSESRQSAENELRIQAMIEKFQAEMAKAREIAEKAAAEAQAAMEAARAQSKAAGEACACGEENNGENEGKTVGESLKDLGEKLNEAAETAAEGIREAADEIAHNETVRQTAEEVKSAGESLLNDARKKLTEAEERLTEARQAYEEAERDAAEAENAAGEDPCGDLSKQARENMKKLADEAGDALKTAWGELKKGWKELSVAADGSFEWLKENTKDARATVKDALREFGENLRSMMSDLGDAGDGECDSGECGNCESCDCETADTCSCESAEPETRLNIEWSVPGEEDGEEEDGEESPTLTASQLDRAQAEAMKTAGEIRADAAKAARKSIEDEIETEKARVKGMLDLVKAKYEEGSLSFEQYMEYTDKYSEYLHTRLTALREELKNI